MLGTPRPPFSRALLAPRLWPAWLGVGIMKLIAMLPFPLLMAIGRALGWMIERFPSPRRQVAATNVALCFPELDAKAQAELVSAHLRDVGLMLVEFALGWMGSHRAIGKIPLSIEGLEHLNAAHAQGRGVLLIGGHFSHLELCSRLVSQRIPIAGMYRRMDNPVFEWAVLRARLGYARAMFDKDDIRGTVKYLRGGGTLWYAPDQDMRTKNNVFVPFFGVITATITGTHHLARLSRAVLVPFFHRRLPRSQGYVLRLGAPLEHMPSAEALADTARINRCIENMVREAPEQYLWVHKRFKTRPEGDRPIY